MVISTMGEGLIVGVRRNLSGGVRKTYQGECGVSGKNEHPLSGGMMGSPLIRGS